MPHFVIDCSAAILQQKTPEEIMQAVYDVAESTGLFADGDIKVRINPFTHFKLGPTKENFIHVFGNIMGGRSITQRSELSHLVISKLVQLFPDVPIISMNVQEFEKATYCNRSMI
ncbi:5-carboxymethyl-2-hydroxymuconate Delta-isomerase [Chitinophaga nivalis]|uniref:5-carboxymethyl-2-hydroxymuconate Delta-isomerase n=1 Tax=Chitinophaga nivalis TaxID=2991709 RepID=A0ABT3IKW5_9BACT|nr:5-carboxymethyl-2-hydroxymuconate Delta-isomerase [Chitinophaga nivalis]MCW3465859.1 5-carboxymethyl-2-hydroxymuconate Delta-isomerase [Chitinophaga nivalis]MCW3484450.1 5-carboxymethyl-2-hydroxymuconate Delta-isomerase [Chitinophaga nivalis]